MADTPMTRRRMLQLAAASAMLAAADPQRMMRAAWASPREEGGGLRTRVARPYDAETDISVFQEWITPNDKFFVRSHFGPPPAAVADPARWRVSVSGLVKEPQAFSLDDLRQFSTHNITAVLQCSGNGRANYRPRLPGVQWERGAVGNARWTGVRLADVLAKAGVDQERAKHVQLEGADRPVHPHTPLFTRSVPLSKALHPDTLLVTQMNGEALPLLHGGPLRVLSPGWMADACTKWLTGITVQDREASGYYMETAYRYPSTPIEPGMAVPAAVMRPVEAMVVKSLIASPGEGAVVPQSTMVVRGVAWTGEGRVTKVEVSTDGGAQWLPAEFVGDDVPYAWRQWEYRWSPSRPGPVTFLSRATDSRGEVQPERSPWNPGGFMWNGWDRVTVTVET